MYLGYILHHFFVAYISVLEYLLARCNKVREVARRRTVMYDDGGMNDKTGKPWSDIADIADVTDIADVADIANFVFTAGTGKHWSDIANILNTGTVNPIASATTTLSPTRGWSMPCG
jgi:hypothetical protein